MIDLRTDNPETLTWQGTQDVRAQKHRPTHQECGAFFLAAFERK